MSRTRYEPVPHRDPEEFSLSSFDGSLAQANIAQQNTFLNSTHSNPLHSQSYNYNTGIPTSVPSSTTPSVAGPPEYRPAYNHPPSIRSIPGSPPPSFHTTSRAGTPRQSLRRESIGIRGGEGNIRVAGDGESLWGVATSTGGAMTDAGAHTEICAAAEALETIKTLTDRVARLEESIGRLLLEAEERELVPKRGRHNCCVTFTDASPDIERVLANGENNCCVSFKGTNIRRESQRQSVLAVLGVVALVCAGVVVVLLAKKTQINSVGEMN